jgi:splicing factor 3B subunit 5
MLYFSAVENESITRIRNRMLEEMVQPCGPPPIQKKKGEF